MVNSGPSGTAKSDKPDSTNLEKECPAPMLDDSEIKRDTGPSKEERLKKEREERDKQLSKIPDRTPPTEKRKRAPIPTSMKKVAKKIDSLTPLVRRAKKDRVPGGRKTEGDYMLRDTRDYSPMPICFKAEKMRKKDPKKGKWWIDLKWDLREEQKRLDRILQSEEDTITGTPTNPQKLDLKWDLREEQKRLDRILQSEEDTIAGTPANLQNLDLKWDLREEQKRLDRILQSEEDTIAGTPANPQKLDLKWDLREEQKRLDRILHSEEDTITGTPANPQKHSSWFSEFSGFQVTPSVREEERDTITGTPTNPEKHSSRYSEFSQMQELGTGACSMANKVENNIDRHIYAVKHTKHPADLDEERMELIREAHAMAALGPHPNLVGYHGCFLDSEYPYIQLELCEGNLRVRGERYFPVFNSEKELLKFVFHIAKALEFIHGRGVVHLDLKPDNIFIRNGVYKIGDFGLANLLSKRGVQWGHVCYIPPEVFNLKHDHLDKADIYSLGISIYELMSNDPMSELQRRNPVKLKALRANHFKPIPGFSKELHNLVKEMLHEDPTKRPSAKELLENPIFKEVKEDEKFSRV